MFILSSCTPTPEKTIITTPERTISTPERTTTTLERTEKVVLPADPVRLTIHQRNQAIIPGSNGQIKIRLGDITGGQVMLSITKDNELIFEPQSIQPGEVIQIHSGDEKLYIKIVRLCNFLIGDDFGEVVVSKSKLEPGISSSQDSQQDAPAEADKPR